MRVEAAGFAGQRAERLTDTGGAMLPAPEKSGLDLAPGGGCSAPETGRTAA